MKLKYKLCRNKKCLVRYVKVKFIIIICLHSLYNYTQKLFLMFICFCNFKYISIISDLKDNCQCNNFESPCIWICCFNKIACFYYYEILLHYARGVLENFFICKQCNRNIYFIIQYRIKNNIFKSSNKKTAITTK